MKISIARSALYFLSLLILGIIFSAYFAPDMLVAITNTVWAMCGW
ncbi:hypothetical protein D521_0893 [beta proteobacterium CB]|nr:hypothetical protein D521_0893 [beta proteobacterium CB]